MEVVAGCSFFFLCLLDADSDEESEPAIPDYDKPGPKAMLPYSSLYIFGPTSP